MTCSFWWLTAACKTTRPTSLLRTAWDRWFREHPPREVPPTLVVLTGVDRPEFGGGGEMTMRARRPTSALRDSLVRAQLDSLRAVLPPTFHDFAAVGLGEAPFGVIEQVVPTLGAAAYCEPSEPPCSGACSQLANQSRAGRLVRQLGEHGRSSSVD